MKNRETESKPSESYVQAVQSGARSGSNLARLKGDDPRGGTVASSWRVFGTVELVEHKAAVADEAGLVVPWQEFSCVLAFVVMPCHSEHRWDRIGAAAPECGVRQRCL
jgi:hypothetical protein